MFPSPGKIQVNGNKMVIQPSKFSKCQEDEFLRCAKPFTNVSNFII